MDGRLRCVVAFLCAGHRRRQRGGRRAPRRVWSGVWTASRSPSGPRALALRRRGRPQLPHRLRPEKSLSVDNLFVFALLFAQTGIPPALQRRALIWGVVGALVMRAVLIGVGLILIERFQWVIYPFAALMLYAAFGMLRPEKKRREKVEQPANCYPGRSLPSL